jgi:hypothetical protein
MEGLAEGRGRGRFLDETVLTTVAAGIWAGRILRVRGGVHHRGIVNLLLSPDGILFDEDTTIGLVLHTYHQVIGAGEALASGGGHVQERERGGAVDLLVINIIDSRPLKRVCDHPTTSERNGAGGGRISTEAIAVVFGWVDETRYLWGRGLSWGGGGEGQWWSPAANFGAVWRGLSGEGPTTWLLLLLLLDRCVLVLFYESPEVGAMRSGRDEPAMLESLRWREPQKRVGVKELDDEGSRERGDVEREEEGRVARILSRLESIHIVREDPPLEPPVRVREGWERGREAHLNRGQALRSRPKGREPVKMPYKITPALHMSTFRPSYPAAFPSVISGAT